MVVLLFYSVIYVSLLLCLCILIVCLCVCIVMYVYFLISTNLMHEIFIISLFQASTCFEHMCSKHVEASNNLSIKISCIKLVDIK